MRKITAKYISCYDKVYNLQDESYIALYRKAIKDPELLEDVKRGYTEDEFMRLFIMYYESASEAHKLDAIINYMFEHNVRFIVAYWHNIL